MGLSSIAFDGIHRCGKGTQISMLQSALQERGIHNLTIRWEHYRDWKWLNYITDPFSNWRHENKMSTDYDAKSQRLSRELRYFYAKFLPNLLAKIWVENSIIIQDRSIVWRYMFKNAEWECTKDIETLQYGKHERMVDSVIVPDLIFVLQPSQQELLRRLETWYNSLQENAMIRHTYKKDYITRMYDNYYNGLSMMPEGIRTRTYHIQSDSHAIDIHQEIIEVLQSRHIFEGDNNRRQET
jgi:thymidylate kinase